MSVTLLIPATPTDEILTAREVSPINGADGEGRGSHAGIVHDRHGKAHQDGATDLAPAAQLDFITKQKSQDQGDQRNDDGESDRQCDKPAVIVVHRGQPHGGHPYIVHGRDPASHDDAAGHDAQHG